MIGTWAMSSNATAPTRRDMFADDTKIVDGMISSLSRITSDEKIPNTIIRELVSQYDWNDEIALEVLMAESGGNPNAVNWNDVHKTCTGSFGLFQLACFHGEDLLNPNENVRIAYELWKREGFYPWTVCTSGLVKCFQTH